MNYDAIGETCIDEVKAMEKQSQIEEQMDISWNMLGQLEKVVANLEGKLELVLKQAPGDGSNNNSTQESLVPLADTIRTYNMRLGNRINDLENIIHRLEL